MDTAKVFRSAGPKPFGSLWNTASTAMKSAFAGMAARSFLSLLTLVIHNVSEFNRVTGLAVEDWQATQPLHRQECRRVAIQRLPHQASCKAESLMNCQKQACSVAKSSFAES